MTHILAIATDAYGGQGGIARYNRDWLAALSDHQIDLLLMTGADVQSEATPAHVRILHAAPGRFAMLRATWQQLRAQRPDWIWCGHLHLAPIAAALAWFWRVPFWLQVHGIDVWSTPSRWRRKSAERAQLITAVSRHTRRELLRWWRGAPEQVRVLPNTVHARFAPDAAGRSQRQDAAAPILLTVGRLSAAEAYKGQDRVIQVLPELLGDFPNLRYQIAGDGDDLARLKSLARSLNVEAQIDFLGQVRDEELPALYRNADLMVMPSTGEGFGIAFLEAMASGTPAMGLRGDGSADALRDGSLGDCVTAAELLAAIRSRLQQPVDRFALATQCRQVFGIDVFEPQVRHLASTRMRGQP